MALRRGGRDPWGKARFRRDSVHTRVYRGACIFHNRIDHAGGAGCALHVAALRCGENPTDWKPQICWQVPLFFEIDDKTKTTTVRASRTVDWGGEGIIDWWCTEHGQSDRSGAHVTSRLTAQRSPRLAEPEVGLCDKASRRVARSSVGIAALFLASTRQIPTA